MGSRLLHIRLNLDAMAKRYTTQPVDLQNLGLNNKYSLSSYPIPYFGGGLISLTGIYIVIMF